MCLRLSGGVASGELDEAREVEMVIERPDGSRITVVVNTFPLRDDQGRIADAINCFYDVAQRSALETKSRQQADLLVGLHRLQRPH